MKKPAKAKEEKGSGSIKLPSFGARYFDTRQGFTAVKVMPGEYYITHEPSEMLVTVLGSCVSACIRDPYTGLGGMNHFMLPDGEKTVWSGANSALRYGNYAMEVLINEVMKGGCPKDELEIKLFGGATLKTSGKDNENNNNSVGSKNAQFVLEYLKKEGLHVDAQDLGGVTPRRIHFYPSLGKVKRLLLRRQGERSIFSDEGKYKSKFGKPKEGSVELFDE